MSRLRLGLCGPAGSGKTYTALSVASVLGTKVAVLDSEHGSASKYADEFSFDTFTPTEFSPQVYMDAIHAAEKGGYDVLIIDSLSHAWSGTGGVLEQVDNITARSKSGNAFSAGWREVSPLHAKMVDAIVGAKIHIIATMRTKTEYVVEKDERGRSIPRKVGMAPVQRDGMEYEFDVVCDMDWEHKMVVTKTRCKSLDGKVMSKPGKEFADTLKAWLTDGVAAGPDTTTPPPPQQQAPKAAPRSDAKPKAKTRFDITVENAVKAQHRGGQISDADIEIIRQQVFSAGYKTPEAACKFASQATYELIKDDGDLVKGVKIVIPQTQDAQEAEQVAALG